MYLAITAIVLYCFFLVDSENYLTFIHVFLEERKSLSIISEPPNYVDQTLLCNVQNATILSKHWEFKNYATGEIRTYPHNYRLKFGLFGRFTCFIETQYGIFRSSDYWVNFTNKSMETFSYNTPLQLTCQENQKYLPIGSKQQGYSWTYYPYTKATVSLWNYTQLPQIVVGNKFEIIFTDDNVKVAIDNNLRYDLEIPSFGNLHKVVLPIIQIAKKDCISLRNDFAPVWASIPNPDETIVCKYGTSVTIKCVAFGRPFPTTIFENRKGWKRNQIKNPALHIKSCDYDDASNYTCISRNYMGMLTTKFNLFVKGSPIFKNITDDTSAYVDNSLIVTATYVSPVKSVNVSLYKNGKPFGIEKNKNFRFSYNTDNGHISFTISDIQFKHSGVYQFIAKNIYGNRVKNFVVNVLNRLEIKPIPAGFTLDFADVMNKAPTAPFIDIQFTNFNGSLKVRRPLKEYIVVDNLQENQFYDIKAEVNSTTSVLTLCGKGRTLSYRRLSALDVPNIRQTSAFSYLITWKTSESHVGIRYFEIEYKYYQHFKLFTTTSRRVNMFQDNKLEIDYVEPPSIFTINLKGFTRETVSAPKSGLILIDARSPSKLPAVIPQFYEEITLSFFWIFLIIICTFVTMTTYRLSK